MHYVKIEVCLSLANLPGQSSVLQSWKSMLSPAQGVPPSDASVAMILTRSWVPPLHVAEQAPQPVQSLQAQSTIYQGDNYAHINIFSNIYLQIALPGGQESALQSWNSMLSPVQGVPPSDASVAMILTLSWVPPLHVAEQAPQLVQSLQEQSTIYQRDNHAHIRTFSSIYLHRLPYQLDRS